MSSYHEGYPPSDDVTAGIRDTLGTAARLEVLYLDAKRRPSAKDIRAAAERARQRIVSIAPGLLIVSDDAAVQHVVVPHFRDGPLPVVFCGVNWSAAQYGLPTRLVTGMIEVLPVVETLATLREHFQPVRRLAVVSERSEAEESNERLLGPLLRSLGYEPAWTMAPTLETWMRAFERANAEADAIYLPTNGAVSGWNRTEVERFVLERIRKPVFTTDDFMMPYAAFGRVKVAREQGEWAAGTALEILAGRSPASIPVARNRLTRALINRALAARIGFTPSPALERELARPDERNEK